MSDVQEKIANVEPRQHHAYKEGKEAFDLEKDEDKECPYPSQQGFNMARLAWFIGWYDARLGRVFKKHGLEYN